ncbi:acetyl-CoA hydrolase/transferase family protein [Chryseosolibacter indicus]|uniref:4-hydroxybutyrate CoA-transferase n=1 Tax=Chryseosolibacter indicus TaxID=2782351 RepID=A0ABS5VSU4_9BACT|nr:acetyl-CoA hydrolase/transferase C-terminal domain-containing protein [Chryseosolibacter indicus]MBT1703910.1 4-hydroxybutyrate CoA-transferase [Chryseosolibacter indicus]
MITTAEEALKIVKPGDRVFIHGGAATPHYLLKKLADRANELWNVELVSISLQGDAVLADKKYKDSFRMNSLFVSPNIRDAVNDGRGDYVPIFLSEIPILFRRNILSLDVALVQVSPPDKHGYCSLGVSVDIAATAVKTAKYVIAQINEKMPRTLGEGIIHIDDFDAVVYANQELPEVVSTDSDSEIAMRIGSYCADLVDDRATLQMGIGSIPDAVLASLTNHKELGVHTEMFSDGIIPLIEKGVITNQHKKKHKGKTVTSFLLGSRKLYNWVDDNPSVTALGIDYVNDTAVIRTNPKVTAINSAIEVDITGQVCSDSIGTYHYSGVGGQMDFMRGAALSEGGKPIIALPSTTSKGISRITPFLKQGAGVVTTRAHAHYIVTEYGVAYLYGKNLRQRAKALIEIAHPNHRETLERAAFERFKNYEFERTYY